MSPDAKYLARRLAVLFLGVLVCILAAVAKDPVALMLGVLIIWSA